MSEETKAPQGTEEAPAPIDPRVEKATAFLETVKGKITARFGEGVIEEALLAKFQPTFVLKKEHYLEVVTFLKDEPSLAFIYPEAMAGTDYMDKGYLEVYAYIHSFVMDADIAVKVRTERENASVPSLASLFPGYNWEEREIFDLLGINFEGHPDMRRIMNTDEWNGHPLRKDYVVQD